MVSQVNLLSKGLESAATEEFCLQPTTTQVENIPECVGIKDVQKWNRSDPWINQLVVRLECFRCGRAVVKLVVILSTWQVAHYQIMLRCLAQRLTKDESSSGISWWPLPSASCRHTSGRRLGHQRNTWKVLVDCCWRSTRCDFMEIICLLFSSASWSTKLHVIYFIAWLMSNVLKVLPAMQKIRQMIMPSEGASWTPSLGSGWHGLHGWWSLVCRIRPSGRALEDGENSRTFGSTFATCCIPGSLAFQLKIFCFISVVISKAAPCIGNVFLFTFTCLLCCNLRDRIEKGEGKGGYGSASGLEACVQRQVPWPNFTQL